ncbi:MAG: 50S ribosomal protein L4 [Bdellovibrionales bacterium]|nr:50S ribosomal protein L4 [Bdellovibrionales bacterium]
MTSVQVAVKDMNGKEVGKLDLDPAVFASESDPSLVHATVRWQRAKRRAGTHAALSRGQMKHSDSKPHKQKGTGRARAGSRNSPLWVGGAVIHGPQPRSYEFRLPKRTRRQAMASVLSDKVRANRLVVLDSLSIESGKTKDMAAVLSKLGVDHKSATIMLPEAEVNVWRSSRNIAGVKSLPVSGANVYDLLNHHFLVGTKDAILALQDRVMQKKSGASEE